MFVRQNQQQFRNSNADVQIFYGGGSNSTGNKTLMGWNKPPGVSQVYMMLIGGGGSGSGNGGGSGAVTVWYGAAQNVPDALLVTPGVNSDASVIQYRATSIQTLLTSLGGNGSSAGTATTANAFAASGFYQSIAGQNGTSGTQSASSTTFLGGGSGNATRTANYGYTGGTNETGYFMLQPIIVGIGGAQANNGGIGCGGGDSGIGGQGMVLIASW